METETVSAGGSRELTGSIISFIGRAILFILSLALIVALGAVACAAGGLGWLLMLSGDGLTLSSSTVPLWPDSMPSVRVAYASAPVFIGVAAAALFIALPFALAVLEKVYVALRPRNTLLA